jgi:hypothetical protein
MSGAQHTPGPWFTNGTEIRKSFLNESDGSYVLATIRAGGAVSLASEQLANARLMAAAPKLLAAVEQLEAYAEAAMHDAEEAGDEADRQIWARLLETSRDALRDAVQGRPESRIVRSPA